MILKDLEIGEEVIILKSTHSNENDPAIGHTAIIAEHKDKVTYLKIPELNKNIWVMFSSSEEGVYFEKVNKIMDFTILDSLKKNEIFEFGKLNNIGLNKSSRKEEMITKISEEVTGVNLILSIKQFEMLFKSDINVVYKAEYNYYFNQYGDYIINIPNSDFDIIFNFFTQKKYLFRLKIDTENFKLFYLQEKNPLSVHSNGYNLQKEQEIIFLNFAEKIQKNISIFYNKGRVNNLKNESFQIVFFAYPDFINCFQNQTEKALDFEYEREVYFYDPSFIDLNQYRHLFLFYNGNPVGFFDYEKDTVNIFYEIMHFKNVIELNNFIKEILKIILSKIEDIEKEGIVNYKNNFKFEYTLDIDKLKKDLAKSFLQTKDKYKNELLKRKEGVENEKNTYLRKYTESFAELNEINASLAGITESKNKKIENLSDDIDKLLQNKDIKCIHVENNNIIVFTNMIICQHKNVRYKIGEFAIKIPFNNSINIIHFYNLSWRINGFDKGMQAPHVFQDGHACFGNIERTVKDLRLSFDFISLINLLICFLQSVNAEDPAGSKINRWPTEEMEKPLDEYNTDINPDYEEDEDDEDYDEDDDY